MKLKTFLDLLYNQCDYIAKTLSSAMLTKTEKRICFGKSHTPYPGRSLQIKQEKLLNNTKHIFNRSGR